MATGAYVWCSLGSLALLAILAPMACSIFSTDTQKIVQLLGDASRSGELGSLVIEYWDRGGPPGDGFESDQLTLKTDRGSDVNVFVRTRFDNQYEPPFRAEEFTSPLDKSAILVICNEIVGSNAIQSSFPEETPIPVGGATKITLKVRAGQVEVSKTFYDHVPAALQELERLMKAQMMSVASKGTLKMLNKKKI